MNTQPPITGDRKPVDRRLRALIVLAVVFSAGHHLDHLIRGNHVGWPVTDEANAFSYSLVVYPLILTGWLLYRAGKVGPGFWLFLSGGGALFVAAIHFGPWGAIEPPPEIIDHYQPRILGWVAFAWLIGFVAVLLITSRYEWTLWARRRAPRDEPPPTLNLEEQP